MEWSGKEKQVQDLSWFDWSIAKDISTDGQSVLFEEGAEPAGLNNAVAIRNFDSSPPIRLGDGPVDTLSPDGKWAISFVQSGPARLKLLSVGPGQSREIALPELERFKTDHTSCQTGSESWSTEMNPDTQVVPMLSMLPEENRCLSLPKASMPHCLRRTESSWQVKPQTANWISSHLMEAQCATFPTSSLATCWRIGPPTAKRCMSTAPESCRCKLNAWTLPPERRNRFANWSPRSGRSCLNRARDHERGCLRVCLHLLPDIFGLYVVSGLN